MTSFWPDDLLAGAEPEPLKTLREQADALNNMTLGRVTAVIDQFVVEGVVILSFVVASNDPNSRYELFRTRTQTGSFPCVIEAHHLQPHLRRIDSKPQLDHQLADIFNEIRTREIIKLLMETGLASTEHPILSVQGPPIEVAGGEKMWSLQFGNVHAFVDEEQILRFLQSDNNDVYAPLGGDRYIVHMLPRSTVRMVASLADIVSLQQQCMALSHHKSQVPLDNNKQR